MYALVVPKASAAACLAKPKCFLFASQNLFICQNNFLNRLKALLKLSLLGIHIGFSLTAVDYSALQEGDYAYIHKGELARRL